MLSASGYGDAVEHLEKVETEAVKQRLCGALIFGEFRPTVERSLCIAEDVINRSGGVEQFIETLGIPLVGELKLVAQVVEAVVDRRSRQHQHFGLDPCTDNLVHQLQVAVLTRILVVLVGGDFTSVAEVMAFVNHDKVVIAPVDVFEVETVARAGRTREVGMIENIIA